MKKSKISLLKFILLFIIYCLLSTGLWGCAGVSKKDKPEVSGALLEPQISLRFNDIPVPAGFKLLTRDSYSFESGGVRVGLLKYRGKARLDQVVNFYKEQMPMYNWYLLNTIEYGICLLNFERERESCIVSLVPQVNGISVTVAFGPKSQIPKKSEKPVK